jgi:hypothetical protein
MAWTSKEKHRAKLLEYMSNPDNDFPTREVMSLQVLGFKQRQQINKVFSVEELHEIEQEALENRRKKYASQLARVDKALMDRALDGDPQAIKLCYQRFEGWSEKQKHDVKFNQQPLIIEKTYAKDDSDNTAD